MKILAIETSCDETAAAVVEGVSPTLPVKVLSSVVASSEEMHRKTGGIVPEVASREQVKTIIPIIDKAIQDSRFKIHDIDAMAVTVGPGLIGSLLVGVETARTLAYAWEKPIIPVNHLIAHLYANFVSVPPRRSRQAPPSEEELPEFPAIGLVVSGGHTDLVLIAEPDSAKSIKAAKHKSVRIRLLGTTRDDAAGECFDKGARILGLPYPGGPAIAAEAAKLKVKSEKLKIKLPRPLLHEETYDFSFSGLKTAVLRQAQDRISKEELAFEIQEAIVEVLVERVMQAVEEFRPKSVLLGGGVAANSRLRRELKLKMQNEKCKIYIPNPKLCTDNAAMIGAAGFYAGKPTTWQEVKADPGLEIV